MKPAVAFLALALGGCTYEIPYPLEVHVGTEWTPDEQAVIVEAVGQWQAVGSGLRLVMVDGPAKGGCTDDFCPMYPVDLTATKRHDRGLTSGDGIQIDSAYVQQFYGFEGLRIVVLHELGHVNGLGPPAAADEHVKLVGDVMCGDFDCAMMGDGTLSRADVDAMISFRELHR